MKSILIVALVAGMIATATFHKPKSSMNQSISKQKLNLMSLCKVSHKKGSDTDRICQDYVLINRVGNNKKAK